MLVQLRVYKERQQSKSVADKSLERERDRGKKGSFLYRDDKTYFLMCSSSFISSSRNGTCADVLAESFTSLMRCTDGTRRGSAGTTTFSLSISINQIVRAGFYVYLIKYYTFWCMRDDDEPTWNWWWIIWNCSNDDWLFCCNALYL